ncbi:MAG: carboxypeptidase regulatory-like domain-containing protein [Terriglobales bacterium]
MTRFACDSNRFAACGLFVILLAAVCFSPRLARAQSLTTGAISGRITDPTGAVVPHAVVEATNTATGAVRTAISNNTGNYTLSQLDPGTYQVRVIAHGFETAQLGRVAVAVSQVASASFKLTLGSATQTVEVSGQAPLLQPNSANTATTVSETAISNLPDAGNDLTYLAQVAPGAIMNSTGGYGDVSFNGLSSLSDNYTLNGLDDNNSTINLNNSGATNMLLGINDVEEATTATDTFGVDHGRLAGAQVNYISKSGTNQFHGNLFEEWNGRAMNANDFFLNATGSPRPFDNVNQFGGAVGGPILHKALFFFVDFEDLHIDEPSVGDYNLPSSQYQNYVLQQLPNGGYDPTNTSNSYCPSSLQGANGPACAQPLPAETQETTLYQKFFADTGNVKRGVPAAQLGCPLNADGSTISYNPLASPGAGNAVPDGVGCDNLLTLGYSALTTERYTVARIDWDHSSKNTYWGQYSWDRGLQNSGYDPIDPEFSATSNQPTRMGQAGWTHVFTPDLVNQFNPGFQWFDAIFGIDAYEATLKTFNVVYSANPFWVPQGGNLPGGYNNTVWQLNDNLSWTRGAHTFKFGESFLRIDQYLHGGGDVIPSVSIGDVPEFTYGAASTATVAFPATTMDPVSYGSLDVFGMDTWQVRPKLTVTYGLRAALNENGTNQASLYSNLVGGDWSTASHGANDPIGPMFNTGLMNFFQSKPYVTWQPRASVAYAFARNTLFKAGFGVFEDVPAGEFYSALDSNPPYAASFTGGLFGQVGGSAILPGVPNSAIDAARAADASFVNLFNNGGLSCAAAGATPGDCIAPQAATIVPSTYVPARIYEWKLSVQRQFGQNFAVTAAYSGTKSDHILNSYAANAFQRLCSGCFSPYPYGKTSSDAPDPRFNSVSQIEYNGEGNYNGLNLSAVERMTHGLMLTLNYTWSHCLDTISNGGLYGYSFNDVYIAPVPGEIQNQYADCDYDITHVANASYLYQLPIHAHGWLGGAVNGWQASGTVFYNSGPPFSIVSSLPGSKLLNTTAFHRAKAPEFANQIAGQSVYTTQDIPGVTQSGEIQWVNPAAFASVYDASTGECYDPSAQSEALDAATCQFGALGRNTLRAPGFFWADFSLAKSFQLTEGTRFKASVEAYNVLNHPNFASPTGYQAGIPGVASTLTGFGTIDSNNASPTSLLGSYTGGANAQRMIALKGEFTF